MAAPDWYSPETTIWRARPGIKAAYRQAVAGGASHIVREVRARFAGVGQPLSIEDPTLYDADALWGLAGDADREFVILRVCGIEVPPVDWHVPEHEGTARLVARVGIVRGYDLYEEAHGTPTHAVFQRNRDNYYASDEPGARLNEVNATQCIVGYPGAIPQPERTHMVDVEPIF